MLNATPQRHFPWNCRTRKYCSMTPGRYVSIRACLQVTTHSGVVLQAFLSSCCTHLRLLSSAFQVTKDDTRLMLRELIHSPTFVYPGLFSLTMNLSDHYFFGRDPFFFESLHKNITESIMEGFKRLQSARDGSVFALFSHSQTRMALDSNQVLIEGSISLIALNSTGPASYESWSNHAIDSFHAKALADEIQRLVSPATFMVCESCSVRFKFCLGLGLKTFLQHFLNLMISFNRRYCPTLEPKPLFSRPKIYQQFLNSVQHRFFSFEFLPCICIFSPTFHFCKR